MFILVPKWAHYYDDFWKAIRTNNLWFIKLRFSFVVGLLLFLLAGEFLLNFELVPAQINAIVIITVSILIFNLVIFFGCKFIGETPGKFNVMHLSLVQMIFDLTALMVLVQYTGMIESPLSMFFIFQMIIGSIILPTHVVFTVAGGTSLVFSTLIFLQHFGVTNTYIIEGLFSQPREYYFGYVLLFATIFSIMLLFSVYLAHTISSRLYKREQQLRETLLELDKAEVTKQRYIMGVVHEIKSPIAAVQAMLDLLLDNYLGPLSQDVENKLRRSKIRTVEALNLINSVLRISNLKLMDVAEDQEFGLKNMIKNLIDKIQESAKSKNITIELVDQRVENIKLHGDELLMELAFSNLLGNSIKYGNENGEIYVTLVSTAPDRVVIEVIDDGIGIPADEITSIFNQFYRAKNIEVSHSEGTGLGLTLVKEIIERHQGTIRVKSPSRLNEEGRPGTEFIITLPLQRQKLSKIDLDRYSKINLEKLSGNLLAASSAIKRLSKKP